MRASQWRCIIRHRSPHNGSPRTSFLQSLRHTRVTVSWLQSPRHVLSTVTKLCTNLPWHVERCILFWRSMVSTDRVHEQPHPCQFGGIRCEYYAWDKQVSANNADECRRKCWRAREHVFQQREDNSDIYYKITTHFFLYSSVLILYTFFLVMDCVLFGSPCICS